MIPLGAAYPASVNVFDENGDPADCATISLTFTLPDQTTVALTPGNPATGSYSYQYVSTMPGRHLVRWVGTSPPVAWTDTFDVDEANPPSIISLADAKQQLGIDPDDTDDDAELRGKLAGLTEVIQEYKHRVYPFQTVTEEHVYDPIWGSAALRQRLRLIKFPAVALISIVSDDGLTTWDVDNFSLDTTTGLVRCKLGPPLRGIIEVTYTAGYQVIPYRIQEGARVMLQHLWATRRGPGGSSGVLGPEELADYRHFTSFPRKVQEWLGPPEPEVF